MDISRNQICGVDEDGDGTYDASELAALAKSIGNLKELNISNNHLKAEGAKILAPALQDSGSLSKLIFYGGFEEYGRWKEGDAVTIDTTMTEADFSGKGLGAAGAQILAAFMSTKLFEAKGSLSQLDVSGNRLCGVWIDDYERGTYDSSGLIALAESISNLKELSISSNLLKAEGARILAPAIEASGALASLTISNNQIGSEQEAKIKQICAGKSIKCTL